MAEFRVGDVVKGAFCSGKVVLVGDHYVLIETLDYEGHDGRLGWVRDSGFVPDQSKLYWSIRKEVAVLLASTAFKGNIK